MTDTLAVDRHIGDWLDSRRHGGLVLAGVVAVLYAAGAESSWRWFGASAMGLAFYPPAGITVAALVLVPAHRRWPIILAAAALAEVVVSMSHGLGLQPTLGYTTANVVEPLVGVSLLMSRPAIRLGGVRLDRRVPMVWFLLCAVAAGPAVGALVGATMRTADSGGTWWTTALQWWVGDGLGVLAVGAPILAWCTGERRAVRGWELVASAAIAAVGSALVFWWFDTAPTLIILPILLWGAVRFGVRGVAALTPLICVIANAATAADQGIFAVGSHASPELQLGVTQLYLAIEVLTAWFVAIYIAERVALQQTVVQAQIDEERIRLATDAAHFAVYDIPLPEGDPAVTLNLEAVGGETTASWPSRVHPEDRDQYDDFPVDDSSPTIVRYRLRHADGRWIHVEDQRAVFTDEHGVPCRLLGVVRDVTADHTRVALAERLAVLAGRLSDVQDVDDLIYVMVTAGRDAFGADGVAALQVEGAQLTLRRAAGYEDRASTSWASWSLSDRNPLLDAVRTARPVVLADDADWHRLYPQLRPSQGSIGDSAAVVLPLLTRTDVWGVVWFSFSERPAMFDSQILDFSDLAGQWSNALRRVLAHQRELDAQERVERLQRLAYEVAAVATTADLATTLSRAAPDFGAESITIEARRSSDTPSSSDDGHLVVRSPIGDPDVELDLVFTFSEAEPRQAAEKTVLDTVTSLIDQAVRRTALADIEHTVAVELQRSLLGTPDPIPWLEVGTNYAAAQRGLNVGGDWYDVVATPHGATVIIGDVVGHSLQAAAVMGQLRSVARAVAAESTDPAELVRRIDRFADTLPEASCTTLVAATLTEECVALRWCRAGHLPPLLVRGDGRTEFLDGGSLPIAAIRGIDRVATETPFAAGDLLVLYTDGLVEDPSEGIDDGLERLRAAVVALQGRPSQDMADRLVAELRQPDARDDVAVLILRHSRP